MSVRAEFRPTTLAVVTNNLSWYFFTYIYLFDPLTYESNFPYEYMTAALPTAFVGGVVYLIVTKLVVQPAKLGGY